MQTSKDLSVIFYGIKNSNPWLVRSNCFILKDLLKNYNFSAVDYVDQNQSDKPNRTYDIFVYYCRKIDVTGAHFGKPLSFEEVKDAVNQYKPKIIIQLGDEWVEEENDIHNSLGNHCELFLRQHRHEKQAKNYTKNTLQIPVGYASEYLSGSTDIKKIKDRELSWSWVGQMTANADWYKVDRDQMIREFWKIWNNTTICDSFDRFYGSKLYNLYSNSIFVPCGRGNWSLECFRNFEATVAGAIPVVAASEKEIKETFMFQELPPWIYADTWEDAVKKCMSLSKEDMQVMQDNNLAWYDRTMNYLRDSVDKILKDDVKISEEVIVKDSMVENQNKTFAQSVILSGGEVKKISLPYSESKSNGFFNPSIFNDSGSLHLNLRTCNYTLVHSELGKTLINDSPLHYVGDDGKIFKTENYFCYIDTDKLRPVFSCKVQTDNFDKEPMWHFSGLEDARLVKWNGKFYLCGTRRDTENTGIGRMELSEIVVEHAYSKEVNRYRIPAPGDDSSYCEKNWMPILDLPYHFVKWTNPTEIVKFDIESKTCKTVLLKDSNVNISNDLRGGSQIISWNEGYLGVVHQAYHTYPNNKFDNEYKQQFIFWDSEWNIVKYSPQFTIMGSRIEFVSGLTICGDDIIMTYGHQDNASFIIRVSQKFVEDFLNG